MYWFCGPCAKRMVHKTNTSGERRRREQAIVIGIRHTLITIPLVDHVESRTSFYTFLSKQKEEEGSMSEQIESVIIGGGQAGLALSYYLTQQGQAHVVLERGRVGDAELDDSTPGLSLSRRR